MSSIKEEKISPVTTAIINPKLKRKELKDKAADMVVGLDSSDIEEFNPQSSKKNKLLNKFYNRYRRKFNEDKFVNTPVTEVLKWDPKKQERWFTAKKDQYAATILGGIAAIGSLPWTLGSFIAAPVTTLSGLASGYIGGKLAGNYGRSLDDRRHGLTNNEFLGEIISGAVGGLAGAGAWTVSKNYLTNRFGRLRWDADPNFRYRNIGNDTSGIEDLFSTGEVLSVPERVKTVGNTHSKRTVNLLRKTFKDAFFGHKGQLVDHKKYQGKFFVGVPDYKYNFGKYTNQWGYFPMDTNVKLQDITINRRILPNLTKGRLYLESSPEKFRLNGKNLYDLYRPSRVVRYLPEFKSFGKSRWSSEDFSNLIGEGMHHKVYKVGNTVLKVEKAPIDILNNPNLRLQKKITSGGYSTSSQFPEIPDLEFLGIKVNPDGKVIRVFKSKFINGIHPNNDNVPFIMKRLGWAPTDDTPKFINSYTKDGVTISDINSKNVLVNNDNQVSIIDPMFNNKIQFDPAWKK